MTLLLLPAEGAGVVGLDDDGSAVEVVGPRALGGHHHPAAGHGVSTQLGNAHEILQGGLKTALYEKPALLRPV